MGKAHDKRVQAKEDGTVGPPADPDSGEEPIYCALRGCTTSQEDRANNRCTVPICPRHDDAAEEASRPAAADPNLADAADAIQRCRSALEDDDMLAVAPRDDWSELMAAYDDALAEVERLREEADAQRDRASLAADQYRRAASLLTVEVEQLRAQVVELCDLFGEVDSWIGMPVEWRDRASRVLKAGRDAAKEG